MSSSSPVAVDLQILDKEYRVACPKEEAEGLRAAARYLDEKMTEIRRSGKVVGLDRIAVMAALNIAHELTQSNGESSDLTEELSTRLSNMQHKINLILDAAE